MARKGRIGGALCALAVGFVVVASPATDAAASRMDAPGPTPTWLGYDRPAEFQTVSTDIKVPMRDSASLRCTMTRPALNGAPAGGEHPVIVVNFFAYRALQQVAYLPVTEYYAQRGYVTLACSPRGSGGTPGEFRPFEAQESRDNYDLIEWAGVQPWSSGKVGQTGASYGGLATYKALATNPPHLKAAIPEVAGQDLYREWQYPGGVRGNMLRSWPLITWGTSATGQTPDVAVQSLPQYLDWETRANAHPLRDSYWKSLAIDIKAVDKTDIPILAVGGWNDLFVEGVIRNFLGAQDQTYLLMLQGAHLNVVPGMPQYDSVQGGKLAFFDRLLMDRQAAPLPTSKVTSWERRGLTGRWTEMDSFPTTGASRLALAGPQGETASSQLSYTVNPFDNGCTCLEHGLYNSTEWPWNTQTVQDTQRLQFNGAPSADDLVIAGTPVAHIKASFDTPEGVLVVRLEDVGPDGMSTVVTTGWLLASHRLGHNATVPVIPGQPADYTVELWPTHWRLAAGHFFRITISSGDLQMIEPVAAAGSTVTVIAGKNGSNFDMPFYRDQ